MPPARPQYGGRPGAPDPVRTIFLDNPSIDFHTSYEALSSLVSSNSDTIASRWRKKTLALRSKCLVRAWSIASPGRSIPERRPRLSERLLGNTYLGSQPNPLSSLPVEEFLFACVNVEQLTNNPANLLNLIYSRSVKPPSNFGRSDYSNFVKPVLKLFGLLEDGERKKGSSSVVMIQADESDYGVVKTWSRQSEDYQQGISKMLICNVDCEGTWLMKWQKTIIDFCLSCVKDILGPGNHQKQVVGTLGAERLLKDVQNFSIPSGAAESRSTSLLTLPYTVPKEFNLRDAHTRALTHLRSAEDHVNLLRSDPNYLLSAVETRLTHRAEHIPDLTGRMGNAESSESVGDTVTKIIHNSYTKALVWNEICILFEDAVQLMSGKQGSWWSSGSSPVLDEKIQTIDAVLNICEDFSKSAISIHACAGPQLRHYFFRAETISFTGKLAVGALPGSTPSAIFMENPINGLFMCMCPPRNGWEAEIFDLKTIADEIEHIVATDQPELKSHVHPCLMNILSDVATVSEIRENIARHVPSKESTTFMEIASVLMRLSMSINDFAEIWPKVDLSRFLGNDQMGWQRMQKAADGGGLERFWEVVDAQVEKFAKGKTLDRWVESTRGRLAKRRKGRWMWQGRVWLTEGAELGEGEGGAEGAAGGEDGELPGLIAVAGFDDSEGYGETQLLGDVFGTENIQLRGSTEPSPQRIVESREGRKPLTPKPTQTKQAGSLETLAKWITPGIATNNLKQVPKLPPKLEPTTPEHPFGINAEGSRGAEPEPAPLPKGKQKTRPATADIEDMFGNTNIDETPKETQEQSIIYVSKRVYQAIANLSTGKLLAWKEFVHLMASLGFTTRPVGGSVLRFVPENEEDEPINIHRPHPDATLGKYECLWIWKRLKRNYGWRVEMFEREKAVEAKS